MRVMEAIAAGGSIIAFVQIAASICSGAIDIVKRYKGAPAEFRQVARQLSLLQSELNFIHNLQGEAGDDNLTLLTNETEDLSSALAEAEALILEVRSACAKHKADGKLKAAPRLHWVFHDQSKFKNVVSRLQQVEMSLQTILLLVNIRIANLSRNAIATASSLAITSNTALLQDVAAIRKAVEEDMQQGKAPENIVLNGLVTRDPHDKNQFWKSIVFLEKSWLHYLGIEAVLSMYGNDYQTTYNLSARGRLYRLLGLRLICLDLRLRRFPIAGLGLSFISGSLSVKNVVPEDSKIMTACKTGDIVSVKGLFRTRQASPHDVTPQNSSPLRYAIEHGSTDLVQVLLASGADVNAPFGQFMTSPLEWAFASRKIDVARLFIARGARVDHISAKGWTPAFNLFGYKWIHETDGSCVEYLELLSAATFSEFDIQDIDGWSAMHRAAAFGTAEDIAALMKRGSSFRLPTLLNWMPIRCSVRFENADTFLELVKHLQPSFVDEQDVRGWTLLHEAASMGSSRMLNLILRHGADPHIVSKATSYVVPEGLENRTVTAVDVAKNKGDDAYKIFIAELDKAGFDITIHKDSSSEQAEDVFWLAATS
ncbi:hypothetical protein EG329_014360 [Mollisiaceae sp. DMI_Dod_QoI]|nr:hypothetical protein EG329_014360 [Helotiales sp. DMI_Dod_QoI]